MQERMSATNRNRNVPTICFVAPNLGPLLFPSNAGKIAGGSEFRQRFLARALVKQGFRVYVVTLDRGQRVSETPDGIRVIYSHELDSGLPFIRFVYPRLTAWFRALRAADADIYFQSCAGFLTLVVGCYCRWSGRRFVYSGAHDLDFRPEEIWRLFQRRAGWRDRQMYLAGIRLSDAIIAQHSGQVEDCRRWFKREPVQIPNCYQSRPGSRSDKHGVVLWVSTLRSWKCPERFLTLARRLPHLRFRMVGGAAEGTEADLFEKTRAEAAQIPNLEFIGGVQVDEVERHFDEARVFVNTSTFEGFPNTFLQSWARGIPTVSLVECHCSEDEKPVGIVCSDIDEITKAVARLADDDQLWTAEGLRARRHFERHHSVDAAVGLYRQLFEELTPSTSP